MNRQKQKGFTLGELLFVLIIVGVIGFGWVLNLVHIIKKYPPLKDWGGSQIVCTIGVVVAPVGVVCGWINGGVPDEKPAAAEAEERPTSVPVDDLVKG